MRGADYQSKRGNIKTTDRDIFHEPGSSLSAPPLISYSSAEPLLTAEIEKEKRKRNEVQDPRCN